MCAGRIASTEDNINLTSNFSFNFFFGGGGAHTWACQGNGFMFSGHILPPSVSERYCRCVNQCLAACSCGRESAVLRDASKQEYNA